MYMERQYVLNILDQSLHHLDGGENSETNTAEPRSFSGTFAFPRRILCFISAQFFLSVPICVCFLSLYFASPLLFAFSPSLCYFQWHHISSFFYFVFSSRMPILSECGCMRGRARYKQITKTVGDHSQRDFYYTITLCHPLKCIEAWDNIIPYLYLLFFYCFCCPRLHLKSAQDKKME